MTEFLSANESAVQKAASFLDQGEVVALPTETVYGLAADATNETAVQKIFDMKGRPSFNPLIVHVSDVNMARTYGQFNPTADLLAQTFWPGPLTLILPIASGAKLAPNVTAGLKTVGLRHPDQNTTCAVISSLGRPVAAPSANVSGKLSPTTPQHVAASFGENIRYIMTGGKARVGLESTIVDLTGDVPALLRAGFITLADLTNLIGEVRDETQSSDDIAPKAPGQMLRHYAPRTPVRLNAVDVKKGEALLAFGSVKFMGIDGGGHVRDLPISHYKNLSETADLGEAASNLFSMLHDLDRAGAERIAVMNIPDADIGSAINDRLRRAAEST